MKIGTQTLTVEQRRYVSVRRIASMANQFASFAFHCADSSKLKSAFTSYRSAMIETLMAPYDWNDYRADVLEMEGNGHFRMADTSHGSSHLEIPFDMHLSFDATTRRAIKPGSDAGMAPFCCWSAVNSKLPGFAILDFKGEESQFRYFQERLPENFRDYKQFVEEVVSSVFRSPPQGAKPTYTSVLSTAVVGVEATDEAPGRNHELFCHGSLHVVCEKGCPFELNDGLWLLSCMPGFASLYRSFGKARLALALDYIKKLPATVPPDIHAELLDAATCLQAHLYNSFGFAVVRIVEQVCLDEGAKRKISDALSAYRKKEEQLSEVIDKLVKAGLPKYVAGRLKDLVAFGNSVDNTGKAAITADWASLAWENVEWIVDELYGASKPQRQPRSR
jgi:hypothetical protein